MEAGEGPHPLTHDARGIKALFRTYRCRLRETTAYLRALRMCSAGVIHIRPFSFTKGIAVVPHEVHVLPLTSAAVQAVGEVGHLYPRTAFLVRHDERGVWCGYLSRTNP